MAYCEDCGTKMGGGVCPWCDEESVIADQYRELGESVPLEIREAELEQIERRNKK